MLGSAPDNAPIVGLTYSLSCLNGWEFWNKRPKHLKLSALYHSYDAGRECFTFEVEVTESDRPQTIHALAHGGDVIEIDQFSAINFADWFPTLEQLPAEELADFKKKASVPLVAAKQETWRDRPPML
jgi:hypothetical protein